jgi:hypothetical protein
MGHLLEKCGYEFNCQPILNSINTFQNKGLAPLCIAISLDGFGFISQHSVCWGCFPRVFTVITFRISKFYGLSTTESKCASDASKLVLYEFFVPFESHEQFFSYLATVSITSVFKVISERPVISQLL